MKTWNPSPNPYAILSSNGFYFKTGFLFPHPLSNWKILVLQRFSFQKPV